MTIWQKLTTGAKFLFGGFDSAVQYLLEKVLNPYLSTTTVAANVQKAYETAKSVLGYLRKYEDWCPTVWLPYYKAVVGAVDVMVGVLADDTTAFTRVFLDETWRKARAAWNED